MLELTYVEAVEYIYSLKSRGVVPGVDNMRALCNKLNNPQDKVRTVHIAGTNGKGSVGAFLGAMLECEGFSIGRYVSPAVEDICEVCRLNGVTISKKDYARCVSIVKEAVTELGNDGLYPTSFEAETAAAFVYFEMKNCDYALVECGMGGRLDATNIISSPDACVLTSISMDHTAFLGDTLEKIAEEKAGIIKDNTIVITTNQSDKALTVIKQQCDKKTARLYIADKPQILKSGIDGIELAYKDIELKTLLCGLYQTQNIALAAEAALHLGAGQEAIKQGVKDTRWDYRFEVIRNKYILDGAHNADGAIKLLETLKTYFNKKELVFIFGVFKDKEYEKMAEQTASFAKKIYTVTPPTERSLPAEVLAEAVKRYNDNVTASDIETAIAECEDEKTVVCFGSLSFLKQVKDLIK